MLVDRNVVWSSTLKMYVVAVFPSPSGLFPMILSECFGQPWNEIVFHAETVQRWFLLSLLLGKAVLVGASRCGAGTQSRLLMSKIKGQQQIETALVGPAGLVSQLLVGVVFPQAHGFSCCLYFASSYWFHPASSTSVTLMASISCRLKGGPNANPA